jgi:hypothetical protein
LAFAVLGIHFLVAGKNFRAFIFFGLAPLFHFSVIVVSLCVVVHFIRNKYVGIAMLLVGLMVLFFFGEVILALGLSLIGNISNLSEHYVSIAEYSQQANIFSVTNLTIYFVLIFCVVRQWQFQSNLNYLYFVLLSGAVISLFLFINLPVFSQRIKELLSIFIPFLVFANYRSKIDIIAYVVVFGASLWSLIRYAEQGIIFT